MYIIERHLQCLNKLSDWADTNGLKFSPSKTVCIHFCKLRKPHPQLTLLLNGTPVPVVEETKFLRVIFDRKLSFIPHIKHLKDKCTKAAASPSAHFLGSRPRNTAALVYIAHTIQTWLWLHCLWICSWLLPANAWSNSKPCSSFVLGCLQNSPTSSLCVEANKPLLYFRRKKLSLQYCLQLSVTTTTLHTLLFSILNSTLYLKENLLNYLLLQSMFQVICKRLVSKRVMLLHLLYQPHRLGF